MVTTFYRTDSLDEISPLTSRRRRQLKVDYIELPNNESWDLNAERAQKLIPDKEVVALVHTPDSNTLQHHSFLFFEEGSQDS